MDFVQYYGENHQQNFRERQDYVDRTTEIMIVFYDYTINVTHSLIEHVHMWVFESLFCMNMLFKHKCNK